MREEHRVSIHGSIRRELLDAYVFRSLDEVRARAQEWKYDYNHRRPHKSLDYLPPKALLPDNFTTP